MSHRAWLFKKTGLFLLLLVLLGSFANTAHAKENFRVGKPPTTMYKGESIITNLIEWGRQGSVPVLAKEDLAPNVKWGDVADVELLDQLFRPQDFHVGDALYFTQCYSQKCSITSDPDAHWVIWRASLIRLNVYTAYKSYSSKSRLICGYQIAVEFPTTETGKWACYDRKDVEFTWPTGTPQQRANILFGGYNKL